MFYYNFTTDSYHDIVLHHDDTLYREDYVTYELMSWLLPFMYGGEDGFWYIWRDIRINNINYYDLNDDLIYNFKKYKKMRVSVLKGSNFVENHFLCDRTNDDNFDIVSNLNILNCSKI